MEILSDVPMPEECASRILEYSGREVAPQGGQNLWQKILQHKWVLSEKLGRDVGTHVSCLDFMENIEFRDHTSQESEKIQFLKKRGAMRIDRDIWETISETQPPKKIVNKRIILPFTEPELALKHGVVPPRALIFFGPPGTGKTHFVRAIAGVLQWWFVEVSPSDLMAEGQDRIGANLKKVMEKIGEMDNVILFIDEFEEIAGNRDDASRIDKSITNELLKQIPILKKQNKRNLLVCATNYIGQLDAALLRPGRFDCIIPAGGLDTEGRKTIFEHYLSNTNKGEVDVDKIVSMISLFTPADVEYLFQKVRQITFEMEFERKGNSLVTTETFLEMIPKVSPTLTLEIIEEFEMDCVKYTRY
ncbi:AAA family ATPase [Desulfogranum marinum]|uniref:ATP-binding protein n=1 Tax=Desulfogranum marinum TaxID=453220 RepID=UPI0029C8E116|nr:AAA family ATPase [Desulfogranum marinum]